MLWLKVCQSLVSLLKKKAQFYSFELCESSMNVLFLYRTPPMAASLSNYFVM